MKLVNINAQGEPHVGVKEQDTIIDLTLAARDRGIELPSSSRALIAGWSDHRSMFHELASNGAQFAQKEESVEFLSAVNDPAKVICVGLNYRRHAKESNLPVPEEPLLFGKFSNTVAGHRQVIDVQGLVQIDYEAELAVIIGKPARNVSIDNALDYVFGYANANDMSERERQFRTTQWLLGKSFDHALPIGPYLVTADEISNPNGLAIRGWLNGELRQDSNTSDMIFTVAEIVSFISHYMSLAPGDIISTGTPEGVILGHAEKVWMKSGDRYEVEIEGLGRLSNRLQ